MFAGTTALVVAWISRFNAALPPSDAGSAGGGPVPVLIGRLGVTAMTLGVAATFAWRSAPHLAALWAPVAVGAGAVLAWRTWSAWMRVVVPPPRPVRLAVYVVLQCAGLLAVGSVFGDFFAERLHRPSVFPFVLLGLLGAAQIAEPRRAGVPRTHIGGFMLGAALLNALFRFVFFRH
jgi:hypothetical protein